MKNSYLDEGIEKDLYEIYKKLKKLSEIDYPSIRFNCLEAACHVWQILYNLDLLKEEDYFDSMKNVGGDKFEN